MVHAQFLEAYTHFTLMYMAYHIFPVLPIKDLINEDGGLTMPFKLATDMKPSISKKIPCVVHKATAHVGEKASNMCHQSQNRFWGIFFGIPQHQKGYLFYEPHKHNIVSLYDFF